MPSFPLEARRRSVRLSSKRKCSFLQDSTDLCLNDGISKMKVCKVPIKNYERTKCQTTPIRNLLDLPLDIVDYLLSFLDVSSLESLGLTCSLLRHLVFGRKLIPTLEFPFSQKYLNNITLSNTIEKKAVLRLRSCKTDETIVPDDEDVFVEYFIASQLTLLNLSKLRELYLLPTQPEFQATSQTNLSRIASFIMFDRILLGKVASIGCLSHVTRLDILLDHNCHLEDYIWLLPNLLHLGLTIYNLHSISIPSFQTFLRRLEFCVSACRAPDLRLEVITESRRKTNKVFLNDCVRRLYICVPCNFNLHLVMPQLEEVILTHPESTCTYYRSPAADRLLHRKGLCGVRLASVFQRCPNIQTFAGVNIGHITMEQSFTKWNNRVRKQFYDDYVTKGGVKDFKSWCKTKGGGRWFAKQEEIPIKIGHEREVF